MADLLTAAQTQLGYAVNEAESGDTAKALTHIAKADAFLKRLAADQGTDIAAAVADAQEWTGTFEEALEKFLDAEDEALKASGQVYGRNGEPRGSMTRQAHIELAESIGVLEELGGPDFFGPEIPGASQ